MRTRRAIVLVLGVAACSAREVGNGSGESGSGDAGSDSSDGSPTAATLDASAATTSAPDTGDVGTGPCSDENDDDDYPKFDIGPLPPACDLFEQDCVEGSKCVPDQWVDTRTCVPIDPDPIPDGDACSPGPSADPCGALSWCRVVQDGTGTCVPLCTGSWADPLCADEAVCIIDDDRITAYCDAPCDPFDASACGQWTCQPTPHGMGCLPGGSHVEDSRCAEHDTCSAGLICGSVPESSGCCHSMCCAPICDDAHPCAEGTCMPADPPIAGAPGVGHCG